MRKGVIATRAAAALTCLVLAAGEPVMAQTEDERAVRETVEAFLQSLGRLRLFALPRYFTPHATIVVARKVGDSFRNRVQPVEEWIEELGNNPMTAPFQEVLSDVRITIDSGQIAYLRARFEIVREGVVQSSGVDVFTLLRLDGEWKIASVGYTSIPAPPP